jgi:Rap1a immunity proteins
LIIIAESPPWLYQISRYLGNAGLGVSGVLLENGNLVDANKNRVPDNGVSMCITEHVSSGAMVQAFRNWAERNPKDWGKEAVLGVMNALHETWPCK